MSYWRWAVGGPIERACIVVLLSVSVVACSSASPTSVDEGDGPAAIAGDGLAPIGGDGPAAIGDGADAIVELDAGADSTLDAGVDAPVADGEVADALPADVDPCHLGPAQPPTPNGSSVLAGKVKIAAVGQGSNGGLILAAHVEGPVSVGGTATEDFGDPKTPDVLLARLDASGKASLISRAWEGGEWVFEPPALNLAVGPAGEIVIVGKFSGPADFGAGEVVGASEAYVVKLDAKGAHVWTHRFPLTKGWSALRGVAVDGVGNVFVTGFAVGTLDLGKGEVTTDAADLLLAGFQPDGVLRFAKLFGDKHTQSGQALAIASTGAVVMTGSLGGQADFGGGMIGSPTGANTIPLVIFDNDGNHQFSTTFGESSLSSREGYAVEIDACDRVYLSGVADGFVDFGDGGAHGNEQAFVASFELDGTLRWSRRYPTFDFGTSFKPPYAGGYALAVTEHGVALAGLLQDTEVDFGGGAIGAEGVNTGFLLAVDFNGDHLFSKALPGAGIALAARALGGGAFAIANQGTVELFQ